MAARKWWRSAATDTVYTSPIPSTHRGTSSFILMASMAGWLSWILTPTESCSSIQTSLSNSAISAAIRSGWKAVMHPRTSTAIRDPILAMDDALPARRLPRPESRNGMALRPIVRIAGKKPGSHRQGVAAHCPGPRRCHLRRAHSIAFCAGRIFPSHDQDCGCVRPVHPWRVSPVSLQPPQRRTHEGRGQRPVLLVVSHGISTWRRPDARARLTGPADAWNGPLHAWRASDFHGGYSSRSGAGRCVPYLEPLACGWSIGAAVLSFLREVRVGPAAARLA